MLTEIAIRRIMSLTRFNMELQCARLRSANGKTNRLYDDKITPLLQQEISSRRVTDVNEARMLRKRHREHKRSPKVDEDGRGENTGQGSQSLTDLRQSSTPAQPLHDPTLTPSGPSEPLLSPPTGHSRPMEDLSRWEVGYGGVPGCPCSGLLLVANHDAPRPT